MKKKMLSLLLVVALAATAVIGGTLAYFTDAEKVTNTMQVGNIDINVEEYMYKDGEKIKFDNEMVKDLYPIADEKGIKLNNKIVDVYNTSESQTDAYIRVILAIDSTNLPTAEEAGVDTVLHLSHLLKNDWAEQGIYGIEYTAYDNVTVDNKVYDFVVCDTLDGKAIPYGSKIQALQSVWLDKGLESEDLEDENGTPITSFDILVLAQGVQTDGFDSYDEAMKATFGEVTEAKLVEWLTESNLAKVDKAVINDLNK